MTGKQTHMSFTAIERVPDKPGEIAEIQILSPMSDGMAQEVGHIIVSWGQMMDWFLRYTKCLIDYNKSEKIGNRDPDFKRLAIRFKEESEKAFSNCPIALAVSSKALFLANRAKATRTYLAHNRIYWGTSREGEPQIVVNFLTKTNRWRLHYLSLTSLQSARQDLSIAQGQFLQLALLSVNLPPYSSVETTILQEIAAKGYLNFPNTPKLERPTKSFPP